MTSCDRVFHLLLTNMTPWLGAAEICPVFPSPASSEAYRVPRNRPRHVALWIIVLERAAKALWPASLLLPKIRLFNIT